MMKIRMRANLIQLPVKIEEIFFGEQEIKIHPLLENEILEQDSKNIEFSSSMDILNESEKVFQVSIKLQTDKTKRQAVKFKLSCIGIYKWLSGEWTDKDIKDIYGWCVSIQIGAARQKLSEIYQTAPYHESWYLPMCLTEIEPY